MELSSEASRLLAQARNRTHEALNLLILQGEFATAARVLDILADISDLI